MEIEDITISDEELRLIVIEQIRTEKGCGEHDCPEDFLPEGVTVDHIALRLRAQMNEDLDNRFIVPEVATFFEHGIDAIAVAAAEDMMTHFAETTPKIRAKYEAWILNYLRSVAKAFKDAGFEVGEPYDATVDQYQWLFDIYDGPKAGPGASCQFTIIESPYWSGTYEGISFAVEVADNVESVVAIQPENWTFKCYVPIDDESEIHKRYEQTITQYTPEEIVRFYEDTVKARKHRKPKPDATKKPRRKTHG